MAIICWFLCSSADFNDRLFLCSITTRLRWRSWQRGGSVRQWADEITHLFLVYDHVWYSSTRAHTTGFAGLVLCWSHSLSSSLGWLNMKDFLPPDTHVRVFLRNNNRRIKVPSPQSHFIRPTYFICICFGILSCSLVFKTCGYTNILYLSYEKCKFHKRGDQKTMCILWIALLSV